AKVKQLSMSKDRLQEPRLDRSYYKGSLDVPFLSLPPASEETQSTAAPTSAPDTLKVAVKVIDEKGQAVKGARVTFLPTRGKIPVATGLPSANGVFETKNMLKAGDYRLRVECVGYVKFEDQVELIEGSQKGKASFTVRLRKPC